MRHVATSEVALQGVLRWWSIDGSSRQWFCGSLTVVWCCGGYGWWLGCGVFVAGSERFWDLRHTAVSRRGLRDNGGIPYHDRLFLGFRRPHVSWRSQRQEFRFRGIFGFCWSLTKEFGSQLPIEMK
ncbi:hypothetical protein RHMOL_Rhmol04G0153100 [Rhododendron molle]|uniref:Uncharacterized protein n=1 Tax=Rhododendron molle TaxID=49168 RepID=A0ACC0P0W2_RHOML|nr:hypothetical protein RHMOL_Rhmol04G0153100 [Rhododendron molle]